jgi:hypothetical protein
LASCCILLVKAIEHLDEAKFRKLTAYLKGPANRRVWTNNHVERTNRMSRFLEKVRYEWRRRRMLARFVVPRLDEVRSNWAPAAITATGAQKPVRGRKSLPDDDHQELRRVE